MWQVEENAFAALVSLQPGKAREGGAAEQHGRQRRGSGRACHGVDAFSQAGQHGCQVSQRHMGHIGQQNEGCVDRGVRQKFDAVGQR